MSDASAFTVLTLDAGGTTLTFQALRGGQIVGEPFTVPSRCEDLEVFLDDLSVGFHRLLGTTQGCDAISFGFPGPSDYPAGIIGALWNMPAFRCGGVPLGPILHDRFGVPVHINNDADLFTLGEAIHGILPEINARLEAAANPRRYRHLLGLTLGTGFGAGIVVDGHPLLGDNASGAEIWLMRHKIAPECYAEEGVSIRAVRRVYAQCAGIPTEEAPEPRLIASIAQGRLRGDRKAALEAWRRMGEVAGEAIACALTLVDGLVVLGGGLSAARDLFMPSLLGVLNGTIRKLDGRALPRLTQQVFDLDRPAGLETFLRTTPHSVSVPGRAEPLLWDPVKRSGVGRSRLGTSHATALGAYEFAHRQALERDKGA